ncbi:MAG TPA: trimeric intracellular cation channel family protein [Terriglobales bacterium]|nr:trimeric intracellular cation channel family protein [Terriglobales bacterium]
MMIMQPTEEVVVSLLLRIFDLSGTFVFAISGAVAGARHRLDLFGVLVLSFVAGSVGGITRDLIIGAIPPASISDWKYVAVSALAGFVIFFWYDKLGRFRNAVLIFDAAGLALFAVSGAGKTLAYGLGPGPAALLGMVTGIGGGVVRDVLVSEVPAVFRTDVYALAALAGATLFVGGVYLHLPSTLVAIVSAIVCFAIRMIAIHRKWQVPVAKSLDPPHN